MRPAVLAVALVAAGAELRGHLPNAAQTWNAVRDARPGWLVAAALLQTVSLAAFAQQQRSLLAAFGVRMTAGTALALSYTRMAMALSLPAGAGVSAAYAFGKFRVSGASRPIAATVMAASEVASVAGLALLSAAAAFAWVSSTVMIAVTAATLTTLALGVGLTGGRRLRVARTAHPPNPHTPHTPHDPGTGRTSRTGRLFNAVRETAAQARTVPTPRWLAVIGLAVLNWTADLACLVAAEHAVGLTVSPRAVGSAYLGAQLLRLLPITAGGIGVIEASLVLAFTAAGAGAAPAAATVILYRLLSCWLVLPIGLACWTAQKNPPLRPPGTVPEAEA